MNSSEKQTKKWNLIKKTKHESLVNKWAIAR